MNDAGNKLLDLLQVRDQQLVLSPEWYRQLVSEISELVNNDFARLVNVLYKVDVSEKKLKDILNNNPNVNAAELIARLLLERQLEKIKSRKAPVPPPSNISDEERW